MHSSLNTPSSLSFFCELHPAISRATIRTGRRRRADNSSRTPRERPCDSPIRECRSRRFFACFRRPLFPRCVSISFEFRFCFFRPRKICLGIRCWRRFCFVVGNALRPGSGAKLGKEEEEGGRREEERRKKRGGGEEEERRKSGGGERRGEERRGEERRGGVITLQNWIVEISDPDFRVFKSGSRHNMSCAKFKQPVAIKKTEILNKSKN
jgi:hypothetical protein